MMRLMFPVVVMTTLLSTSISSDAFTPTVVRMQSSTKNNLLSMTMKAPKEEGGQRQEQESTTLSRREWMNSMMFTAAMTATIGSGTVGVFAPEPAQAVGPVKINLLNPTYTAIPCPKDKPIPGEKAMKGMKGLCVTVNVDMENSPEKPLEKVGVYGFVTDKGTGESVLANNPDLSTDAGQFAMIEEVTPKDKKLEFEFIAAVPREMDTSQFEEGIAPLEFGSLRVISFPGGQQYGAINPCEMNEFSDECEAWEEENGPYVRGDFMVKSNPRTKGR